jgi:hypothetical protein
MPEHKNVKYGLEKKNTLMESPIIWSVLRWQYSNKNCSSFSGQFATINHAYLTEGVKMAMFIHIRICRSPVKLINVAKKFTTLESKTGTNHSSVIHILVFPCSEDNWGYTYLWIQSTTNSKQVCTRLKKIKTCTLGEQNTLPSQLQQWCNNVLTNIIQSASCTYCNWRLMIDHITSM